MLALDTVNTPAPVHSAAGVATVATASFTPPAGSVLVATWAGNEDGVNPLGAPTITNSGTLLTWTRNVWSSRNDGGTGGAGSHSAIWTAPVPVSAAMTVTVTNGQTADAHLRVRVQTGANVSNPVGATAKGGGIGATPSSTYTSTAPGSVGIMVCSDWNAPAAGPTVGTGVTQDAFTTLSTQCAGWTLHRTAVAPDQGTSVTVNVTTTVEGHWSVIELIPAAPLTVQHAANGTRVAGAASAAPSYPTAGVVKGQLAVAAIGVKPDTANSGTPAGWTSVANASGGTGVVGAGTGPVRVYVFIRVLDGTESGAVTFTGGGTPNVLIGTMITLEKPDGSTWEATLSQTSGADATHGLAWSATGGANLSLAVDDLLLIASAGTANAAVSAQAVTATGATLGTVGVRSSGGTGTGNDVHIDVLTVPVTAGPSSAAPVHTRTDSINNSGVTAFVRVRAIEPTRRPRRQRPCFSR